MTEGEKELIKLRANAASRISTAGWVAAGVTLPYATVYQPVAGMKDILLAAGCFFFAMFFAWYWNTIAENFIRQLDQD